MSKVADNWHPKWYSMLYEQEGLCKMEHKGKWIASRIMLTTESSYTIRAVDGDPKETWPNIAVVSKKEHAERICKCVNGWDELQARLETAERLVLQGGAGHDEIVKKAVGLQKQRDDLLTGCKLAMIVMDTQQEALKAIAKGVVEKTGKKLNIPKLPSLDIITDAIAEAEK